MRIPCPHCGERSLEEFVTIGTAPGPRPPVDGGDDAWAEHTYFLDNPAGPTTEHWQHLQGCRAWLVVRRDTRTHAILDVRAARETA